MTESQISIFDEDTSAIRTKRSNPRSRVMVFKMEKVQKDTQKIITENKPTLSTENSQVSMKEKYAAWKAILL